jgi:hypothetical protein
MKAEGIEYEERIELLDDVTWPKPLAELLEATYEIYRQGHPWIAEHELSPKSVVRDMVERAMTFGELISFYGLSRSEGMVLRYLTDAYKALRHTVPDSIKTDELTDLIEWLGEVVRQTDSSLLDEWERLTDPDVDPLAPATREPEGPRPVSANVRAFRVMVRNAIFRRVELAALRRWDDLAALESAGGTGETWTADRWREALEPYWEDYDDIGTGPDARGPRLLMIEQGATSWRVRQVLDDPEGDHDWAIVAEIDLALSDERGEPAIGIVEVGPL